MNENLKSSNYYSSQSYGKQLSGSNSNRNISNIAHPPTSSIPSRSLATSTPLSSGISQTSSAVYGGHTDGINNISKYRNPNPISSNTAAVSNTSLSSESLPIRNTVSLLRSKLLIIQSLPVQRQECKRQLLLNHKISK